MCAQECAWRGEACVSAGARLVVHAGQQPHVQLRGGVVEGGQLVTSRPGVEQATGAHPRVGLVAPQQLLSR
eukprot:scaffold9787_cov96-Isochrysis_galbana.AAC.1